MKNCTGHKKNCTIPLTTLESHLETQNCSVDQGGYGKVSCYDGDVSSMLLDYENISRMGCRFLLSGAVSEITGSGLIVSLDIQVVELGWWLKGTDCDCSDGAECTKIVSPTDGSDGYRCKCKTELDGNGYKASSGCGKIKGMSPL